MKVPSRRGRARVAAGLALAALVAAGAADLARPPDRQLSARVLLAGIGFYRHNLSRPVELSGVRCRFEPTCSAYAEAVIRDGGALRGSLRAVWRLLRCAPWTPAGTLDPP